MESYEEQVKKNFDLCQISSSNFIFFDLVFENAIRAPKSSFFYPIKWQKDKVVFFWTDKCWCKVAFWTFSPNNGKKEKFIFFFKPVFSGIRATLHQQIHYL
jgi:hypothetical protein